MDSQEPSACRNHNQIAAEHCQIGLIEALHSSRKVEGLTHGFYRYPARFSPEFVRAVIEEFTKPGDCVLDSFMGGGTTIVEAIAAGRRAIGIDVNPISHFISSAKTTPLSHHDHDGIVNWATSVEFDEETVDDSTLYEEQLKNTPPQLAIFLSQALSSVDNLRFPRQRRFARCVLLRLGQWALESRSQLPDALLMQTQLVALTEAMLSGLDELVEETRCYGISKNKITSRRALYLGTLTDPLRFGQPGTAPKLVVTSPPYPGVHVLYHRWQVKGRRETGMPYWLAGLRDGHGPSYYTMGGRSSHGVTTYFLRLTEMFKNLREFIRPDSLVVQLVAFPDLDRQLPAFLEAMHRAQYKEITPYATSGCQRPSRTVPNRKWYTSCGQKKQNASVEILLFHTPMH